MHLKACRKGYRVLYLPVSRLFQDLAIARADGRYDSLLRSLAGSDFFGLPGRLPSYWATGIVDIRTLACQYILVPLLQEPKG